MSLAVVLATPMGILIALRRGLVIAASVVAAVVFLGTCLGGVSLMATSQPSQPVEAAKDLAWADVFNGLFIATIDLLAILVALTAFRRHT